MKLPLPPSPPELVIHTCLVPSEHPKLDKRKSNRPAITEMHIAEDHVAVDAGADAVAAACT